MTIYDRAKAVVERQLAGKVQLGAIRRTEVSGGGPSDWIGGIDATTDYPARMVVFPVDQKDINGTLIKSGDWRVIMSPSQPADASDWSDGNTLGNIESITPTTTDKLVCTEGVLTIIDPGKFAPDGTVTHLKMVARKS